ncbi:hypothetical protein J3E69DRAFT_335722 [Trichoderma sp. SZMC 28015]
MKASALGLSAQPTGTPAASEEEKRTRRRKHQQAWRQDAHTESQGLSQGYGIGVGVGGGHGPALVPAATQKHGVVSSGYDAGLRTSTCASQKILVQSSCLLHER